VREKPRELAGDIVDMCLHQRISQRHDVVVDEHRNSGGAVGAGGTQHVVVGAIQVMNRVALLGQSGAGLAGHT
jgi:proteasome assembly chaperone (PAC2) family protein